MKVRAAAKVNVRAKARVSVRAKLRVTMGIKMTVVTMGQREGHGLTTGGTFWSLSVPHTEW